MVKLSVTRQGVNSCAADMREIIMPERTTEPSEFSRLMQLMMESFPDHIYVWDIQKNTRIMENNNTANVLGYKLDPNIKAEDLQVFYRSIMRPDCSEMHRKFRKEVHNARENEIYEMTLCVKAADGSWKWLNYREKLLRTDETGNPQLMLGVARDVSALKEAEFELKQAYDELAASQARLKAIIESQTVFVCRYKSDGTLTFANQAVCDLVHRTQEELIGKSFFRFFVQDDQCRLKASLGELTHASPLQEAEYQVKLSEGKTGWQHWINRGIFDESGVLVEYQSTGWDISGQKEAQQRSQQLIDILEATPDIIATMDADNQIIYMNKAGYEFLKIPPGTVLTRINALGFYPSEVKEYIEHHVVPVLMEKGMWGGETVILNGDHEEIPVSQVLIAHHEGGTVTRFSTILRDIRYFKEIEQRFREQELHIQEQQTRLIVNELHDRIGQNLTALNLNLAMMEKQVTFSEDGYLKQRLDDSIHLVDETMASIRGIMSDLRPPELDDYGLVAALRSAARQLERRTGIKVELQGEDLKPGLPLAQAFALYRIAQEALTNVAKYSQATRVVIEVKDKNNTVTMTISDNGKGVNLRSLPASRSQPGWGISSMRTRAEDLGARFTIKGSPGKGTQVKVELERGV